MKRSLVAATAVALLLTGCATGDTGHLVPDIDPELLGPSSTPAADAGGSTGDPDDSGSVSTEFRAAFADAAGVESWLDDVTEIAVDGSSVTVTTAFTAAGGNATAVCEAAVRAAETTGVTPTSVTVVDAEGTTLSELDAEAGDEACSD